MSIINESRKTFLKTKGHNVARLAIDYLEKEEPHNADEYVHVRNLRIYGNADLRNIIHRQMVMLKRAGRFRKDAVALESVVVSYSPDELDYRNPADVEKAGQMVKTIAEDLIKKHPGRYYAAYLQADGVTHHLHGHILLTNYNEDMRPLQGRLSWKKELAPLNERVTRDFITSERGKAAYEKDWENSPLRFGNQKKRYKPTREEATAAVNNAVTQALTVATSRQDFADLLRKQRVYLLARSANDDVWQKKYGGYRKNVTFMYRGVKVRSGKIGLSAEALDKQLQSNAAEAAKAQAVAKKLVQLPVTKKLDQHPQPALQQQPAPAKPKPQPAKVISKKPQHLVWDNNNSSRSKELRGFAKESIYSDVMPETQQGLLRKLMHEKWALHDKAMLNRLTEKDKQRQVDVEAQINSITDQIAVAATQSVIEAQALAEKQEAQSVKKDPE